MPAARTVVERWSDWACAGGVALGELVVVAGSYGDDLDGRDSCRITILHDPHVPVALRDVLRVTGADGSIREYRVQARGRTLTDGRRTISGVGPLADLATAGLVRSTSGGATSYAIVSVGTPADVIDATVLTNLSADGVAWLARGTVDPTAVVTLTAPATGWTRLEWLRQLANATGAELRLRRNGSTGYYIDLVTAIGSSAATVAVVQGKNLLAVQDDDDDGELASAITVLGDNAAGIGENIWTLGTIPGSAPYWIGLTDPAGGAPPVAFDDQLNGKYLLRTDGGATEITDSRASDSAVLVAATTGLTAGQLAQVVLNSTADRLAELAVPGVSRLHRVDTTSGGGVGNLVRNPVMLNWTSGSAPAGFTATTSGSYTLEYPRNLPRTYTGITAVGSYSAGNITSLSLAGFSEGDRLFRLEGLTVTGQENATGKGILRVASGVGIANSSGQMTIDVGNPANISQPGVLAVALNNGEGVYPVYGSPYSTVDGPPQPVRPVSFPTEAGVGAVMRAIGTIDSAAWAIKYRSGLPYVNAAAGLTMAVVTAFATSDTAPVLAIRNTAGAGTTMASVSMGTPIGANTTRHETLYTSALLTADTTVSVRVVGPVRSTVDWFGIRWVTLWLSATAATAAEGPINGSEANALWQRGNRALTARQLASRQLKVSLRDLSTAAGYSLTREQLALGGTIRLDDLDLSVRVIALTYSVTDPGDVDVLLDSRPTRLIKFLAERL